MKNNPVNKGVISENFRGVGTVSRNMVHQRASELAQIEGRNPLSISQADYEQAKRELTGESDIDRQEAILDSLPESERWDPVPGSTGHETPGAQSEDMDDEGKSESEQLVEQGVEEAEHDQMLQAAKAQEQETREGN
jgi:hypothetical protein